MLKLEPVRMLTNAAGVFILWNAFDFVLTLLGHQPTGIRVSLAVSIGVCIGWVWRLHHDKNKTESEKTEL